MKKTFFLLKTDDRHTPVPDFTGLVFPGRVKYRLSGIGSLRSEAEPIPQGLFLSGDKNSRDVSVDTFQTSRKTRDDDQGIVSS